MYFMARRTKVEMALLDQKIRPLYEKEGLGCRSVAKILNESPAIVFKRTRAMGILRQKDPHQEREVQDHSVPFTADVSTARLRWTATATAAAWFASRGYVPSIPIEPTKYDLLVESDDGIKRVQVKTASTRTRGKWWVGIHRHKYCDGKWGKVPYQVGEIDLFFICVADGGAYLIPEELVRGKKTLVLDVKYMKFRCDLPS
jgi:hypothetical protein